MFQKHDISKKVFFLNLRCSKTSVTPLLFILEKSLFEEICRGLKPEQFMSYEIFCTINSFRDI